VQRQPDRADPDDGGANLADRLLKLEPGRFAREARGVVEALPDHQRGVLASALVEAFDGDDYGFADAVAALGLDSADPSLMSSTDVVALLGYAQRERPDTFRRALRALREHPRLIHLIGAPFAPMSDSSDTSHIAKTES
jgi:hypothetical protein